MPISWANRYVKKRAVANKLFFLLYLFVVLRITNNRYRRTMKKMVCLLSVCLALASCGMQGRSEKEIQTSDKAVVENSEVTAKDHVEVVYFHGKQRCATCIAIENNTLAVMKENLSEQVKKGEVVFKVIDISKKENEKIAEKYEVTWSSLLVVRYKNGQETAENMTQFAFGNARKSPEVFKEGLVKTVNDMLK